MERTRVQKKGETISRLAIRFETAGYTFPERYEHLSSKFWHGAVDAYLRMTRNVVDVSDRPTLIASDKIPASLKSL